ncbi:MAG UNVERIFIED_CONTAM: hypothetical protein LVR18_29165 [Planctomycetaceae bacterium]
MKPVAPSRGRRPAQRLLKNRIANQFLLDQRATQLTTRINSVDENGKPLTVCMGVQDRATPQNARLLVRGEIDKIAQEVPRGFVQVLSSANAVLPPTPPEDWNLLSGSPAPPIR